MRRHFALSNSIRKVLITLLGLMILLIPASLGLLTSWYYFRIDSALQNFRAQSGDQYYSAPLMSADITGLSELEAELLARSYQETEGSPQPGEYERQSTAIRFHRRAIPWVSPFERTELVEVHESHFSEPKANRFLLEPLLLSASSSSSIKHFKEQELEHFPQQLRNAFLAAEDHRFYSHLGLDLLGIARAIVVNIQAGALRQGASTLTQQLAKNILLSPKRSFRRKFLEVFASLALELRFSKDELFELYLNSVYLGQMGVHALYGVETASQAFFDRSASELSLAQMALLAGLPKAPTSYSPKNQPVAALKRRNLVLERMFQLGFVNGEERSASQQEAIELQLVPPAKSQATHFVQALRAEMQRELGFESAGNTGLRVVSTLRPAYQSCAEKAVKETKFPKGAEVGLLALDAPSAEVVAWVGGRDYSKNQFDHVSQARRQVGSTLKPFIFLQALDPRSSSTRKIATTRTVLKDSPFTWEQPGSDDWKPQNYDKKFLGDLTLRYALEHSRNVPAVRLLQESGLREFSRTLNRFGIAAPVKIPPATVLGSIELSLFELTQAYNVLANLGEQRSPLLIQSISDKRNRSLFRGSSRSQQVADPGAVFILTDILRGVVERGTAKSIRKLGARSPAAGKTGTSDEKRDAWFIGFTPELSAGVWVGRDDNLPLGLGGGGIAAPIFGRFLSCVEKFRRPPVFVRPDNVKLVELDQATGLRYNPRCLGRARVQDFFLAGSEPKAFDCHGRNAATPAKRRKTPNFWDRLFS